MFTVSLVVKDCFVRASWEMNVHLFLRKICQYNLPLVGFFLDVLTKGFVQKSPQSIDERKINAERVGAIMH